MDQPADFRLEEQAQGPVAVLTGDWTAVGMGLANITGEVQELIIGVLLIASILISNLSRLGMVYGRRQKGKSRVVDPGRDV